MSFDIDLERGEVGAQLFLQRYGDLLIQLPGTKSDFIINVLSEKVELKTCYQGWRTGNFYMESWSKIEKKEVGGPWQAALKGSVWYCYQMVVESTREVKQEFWFRVDELIAYLNENRHRHREQRTIKDNDGYTTYGLLVPVEDLKHLVVPPLMVFSNELSLP